MRTFLEEIGTHWFPVEFDPYECMKREQQVQNLPFFCERLLKTFTAERLRRSPEIKIVDLSESLPSDFFGLGHFMDWLAPQRDEIIEGKAQLGRRLKEQIVEHRAKYDKDHSWLDTTFPQLTFRPDCPATFVYINLVRLLILESKGRTMMPNDGIDFGQAVIGSAYFSLATLDKDWKRRVELLPPSKLARIYYQQELDQMVRDLERNLDNRDKSALQRGRVLFHV